MLLEATIRVAPDATDMNRLLERHERKIREYKSRGDDMLKWQKRLRGGGGRRGSRARYNRALRQFRDLCVGGPEGVCKDFGGAT